MEAMAVKPIEVKDDEKIMQQSLTLVEQAQGLVIKDDVSAQQASDLIDVMDAFLDGPGKYHDAEIDMAFKLHRFLTGKKNAIVKPVVELRKIKKDELATYIDAKRVEAEETERKARAAAERIENERKAKVQAKIDEENAKAEAAKMAGDTEAVIEAETKAAQLAEKKENIYVETKPVAAAFVPQGVSVTYDYEVEVLDKKLIPMEYLEVNESALKKVAKATKGAIAVPGVRFIKKAIGAKR